MLLFSRDLYHHNRKEARASSYLHFLYLPWLDILAVSAACFLLTNPDSVHSRVTWKPAFALKYLFSLSLVSSADCDVNDHIDSALPSTFLLVLRRIFMLQEGV